MINLYFFPKGLFPEGFESLGTQALAHGVNSLYKTSKTNYGPVYLYAFMFEAWLTKIIFSHVSDNQLTYIEISKSLPVLMNLIIGLLICWYIRGRNKILAFAAACLYWFNPFIIYNAAYWGQVDAANTLALFLSVLFIMRRKYEASLISLTVSILIKVQSLFILVFDGKLKTIAKAIILAIVAAIIAVLPFILGCSFFDMVHIVVHDAGY